MSLDMSDPVRVKMIGGENYVGYIQDVSAQGLELKCVYKFVRVEDKEGMEEKVLSVLMDMDMKDLLVAAVDLGILKKGLLSAGLRTSRKDFLGAYKVIREDGEGVGRAMRVGKLYVQSEQKRGLCSVLATAMMNEMEPELVPLQAPVTVILADGSWESISSLIDEGQEKLFERWAQDRG